MAIDREPGAVFRDARGWVTAISEGEGRGRTYAVECGVEPRIVSTEIAEVVYLPSTPDLPWIGYVSRVGTGRDTEFHAFDPWGDAAPEALPGRPLVRVGIDTIVFGDPVFGHRAPGRLVEVQFERRVSIASTSRSVVLPAEADGLDGWLASAADEIPTTPVAVATAHLPDDPITQGIVEIDLATGKATIVRRGARLAVNVRLGDRFVPLAEAVGAESSLRSVFDLVTGVELGIGPSGALMSWDPSVAIGYDGDDAHLVLLPELREIVLEGTWLTDAGLVAQDGGRVLMGPAGTYLLAAASDTPRLLDAAYGRGQVIGDEVWVHDHGMGISVLELLTGAGGMPYRLVRIPLDGTPAQEVLSAPVYASLPLSDGRWAVIREIDDDLRGSLLLVDPKRETEHVLAEGVSVNFIWENRRVGPRPSSGDPSFAVEMPYDDLVFTTGGEDNDAGLWRLAP